IRANGVGNVISILIVSGSVAVVPEGVKQLYIQYFVYPGSELFINIVIVALIVLVVLEVTAGVVYIQQAERKIPIEYAKRLVNRSPVGGQTTHLTLKVNTERVIQIIFSITFIIEARIIYT